LEDRIVKQFFAGRSGKSGGSRYMPVTTTTATFTTPGKWPCVPQADEIAFNPRARSAKLRAGMRLAGAAALPDADVFALARLPERSLPLRRKAAAASKPTSSKPTSRRR
ncbi:MAG: 16S rRNA (cytosine(1402)-N(4))-methyltransferase, partial [Beijerinckiaceae bacterium]